MHSSGSDTPREKEYEREDISNLTKAKSKGGGGVSASWRSQNGVSRPSWTASGGQDGVSRPSYTDSGGQMKAKRGPKGGQISPFRGPRQRGCRTIRPRPQKRGSKLVENRRHRGEARTKVCISLLRRMAARGLSATSSTKCKNMLPTATASTFLASKSKTIRF